jgi:imidazolonepropionase-like amidohydrolase
VSHTPGRFGVLAALAAGVVAWGCTPEARSGAQSATVVIDNVHVIPMDAERIIRDARVVVRDDVIVEVGARGSVSAPPGATQIDGGGGYLIPGLTDMHVHLYYGSRGLPSYLAYGVTTIANLNGTPDAVDLRDAVRAGRFLGPTIYTTGPSISGTPPGNPLFVAAASPDDARAIVRDQKAAGFDMLKIYSFVTPEVYAAVMDEARRMGIGVVGHVPQRVGAHAVLAERQANIAHIEEIIRTGNETRAEMDSLVASALANGVTITPNIFAYSEYLRMVADLASPSTHDERRYQPPGAYVENLPHNSRANRPNLQQFGEMLSRRRAQFRVMTKLLTDAGVPIFVGTDTEIFGFPGHSAQSEVFELVESGLTPYQALVAATRAPGSFLGRVVDGAPTFGTITPGSRADLVLLEANPLEDIRRLSRVDGVMLRGQWLPGKRLQALRDSVAALNASAQRTAFIADSLVQAGDGQTALATLRAAPPSDRQSRPTSEALLRRYGRSLLARDTASALAFRRLAVEWFPSSHSAHTELAAGLIATGDTSGAREHLNRSLALMPHNDVPRTLLARLTSSSSSPH